MLDYTKKAALVLTASKPLVDWLLALNTKNRALKNLHTKNIADEIERGEFVLTSQGIGITANGVLTDGQHRLQAIAMSGYPPVEILVVTGLDEIAMRKTDQLMAKRSMADVLKLIMNKTVSTNLVAAVTCHLKIKIGSDGFFISTARKSEGEIADFLENYSDEITNLFDAAGGSLRAGIMAAMIDFALYDIDMACSFARQVRNGERLVSSDPAYKLRDYIIKNKNGGGGRQVDDYAVTVTACIAYAREDSMAMLRKSSSWERLPKKLSPADDIAKKIEIRVSESLLK